MSAVTLTELLADYESACSDYLDYSTGYIQFEGMTAVEARYAMRRLGERRRQASVMWHIARDHGLEAAMLYKLSDGAIDPRKGGDE